MAKTASPNKKRQIPTEIAWIHTITNYPIEAIKKRNGGYICKDSDGYPHTVSLTTRAMVIDGKKQLSYGFCCFNFKEFSRGYENGEATPNHEILRIMTTSLQSPEPLSHLETTRCNKKGLELRTQFNQSS